MGRLHGPAELFFSRPTLNNEKPQGPGSNPGKGILFLLLGVAPP
jgi:hypothetical protein